MIKMNNRIICDRQKKSINNAGFSLVELIIVIAIMAILAASIAPSVIRYIHKSKVARTINEAKIIRDAVVGGVAIAAETDVNVNLNKKYTGSDGVVHKNVGVITNKSISKAQAHIQNGSPTGDVATYQDWLISCEILKNLGCYDDDVYGYMNFQDNTNKKPIGMTVQSFEKAYHCPGLILIYDKDGNVVFMDYSNRGILIRYEFGEFYEVEDGKFIAFTPQKGQKLKVFSDHL